MQDRARELEELQEALRKHGGGSGRDEQQQPELEVEQENLQVQFQQLIAPLAQRRGKLEEAKAVHQFYRDLADELVSLQTFLFIYFPIEMSRHFLDVVVLFFSSCGLKRGCLWLCHKITAMTSKRCRCCLRGTR